MYRAQQTNVNRQQRRRHCCGVNGSNYYYYYVLTGARRRQKVEAILNNIIIILLGTAWFLSYRVRCLSLARYLTSSESVERRACNVFGGGFAARSATTGHFGTRSCAIVVRAPLPAPPPPPSAVCRFVRLDIIANLTFRRITVHVVQWARTQYYHSKSVPTHVST